MDAGSVRDHGLIGFAWKLTELPRTELSKLAATPTLALLVVAVVALTSFSAVGYLLTSTGRPGISSVIAQDRAGLLVAVFGGVTVLSLDRQNGSESIWLVARPNRRRYFGSKMASSPLLGAALGAVALATSTLVAVIAAVVSNRTGTEFGRVGEVVVRHPLGYVLACMFGAGVASLSRSYVWSVVIAVVVIPVVEPVAEAIIPLVGDAGPYSSLRTIFEAGELEPSGGQSVPVALLALVVAIGLLSLIGLYRFESCDVGQSN